MDFKFETGDKFDPSTNAVVRTTTDNKGILHTTYIAINPTFIGWSVIPGYGIKSPAPEDKVLLTDGSILDLQHGTHTSSSGAISELKDKKDENGNIVIDMQAGGDLILKTNASGVVVEFQSVDAEKPDEPPKPIKPVKIDDKIECSMPYLIETASKNTKAVAFNLMAVKNSSYTFKTNIPGKTDGITSTLTVEKELEDGVMFSIGDKKNGTILKKVVSGAEKNYFLEFSPDAEQKKYLVEYLEKKGKSSKIEITPDGKVKFQVEKCYFSNANGFHVTALGGAIKFDANAASNVVTINNRVFTSQHTPQTESNGESITLSSEFIEETFSGNDDLILEAVKYNNRDNKIHKIEYPDSVSEMPVDIFLALANLQEPDGNGIKRYGDESSKIQVFLAGVKNDDKGTPSSLMLVRIGEERYVYHNCSLLKLNKKFASTFYHDDNHIAMAFAPTKNAQGNRVGILGIRTDENETVFKEANAFLGSELGATKDTQYENGMLLNSKESPFAHIISNTKKNINSNPKLIVPEVEPIVNKEKPGTHEPPPPPPPEDKKKKTNFWNTLANASFFAMMFCLIGCMFGIGFVALPLAIAFGAAGALFKGIAWQGGFGAEDVKAGLAKAKAGKDKKSKDNSRQKTRAAKKYKSNLNKINNKKNKIKDLKKKLESCSEGSRKAKKLKNKIKKAENKIKELERKNTDEIKNASTSTLLSMLGTKNEDFDLENPVYKKLIEKYMAFGISTKPVEKDGKTEDCEFMPDEENNTLEKMSPNERAWFIADIKNKEEDFGTETDFKFAEERLKQNKREAKGKPLTEEEKNKIKQIETLLGPDAYKSWSKHIDDVAKVMAKADEEFKATHKDLEPNAPELLKQEEIELAKMKNELKKMKEKQARGEKIDGKRITKTAIKEKQGEIESKNATITKTKNDIDSYFIEEYNRRFDIVNKNEDLSELEKLEEMAKLDAEFCVVKLKRKNSRGSTIKFDIKNPKFAENFEKIKYNDALNRYGEEFGVEQNPITRRYEIIDRTVSFLDSKDHAAAERAKRAAAATTESTAETSDERTAETPTTERTAETPTAETSTTERTATETSDEHSATATETASVTAVYDGTGPAPTTGDYETVTATAGAETDKKRKKGKGPAKKSGTTSRTPK